MTLWSRPFETHFLNFHLIEIISSTRHRRKSMLESLIGMQVVPKQVAFSYFGGVEKVVQEHKKDC